jgi:hypothetical protein
MYDLMTDSAFSLFVDRYVASLIKPQKTEAAAPAPAAEAGTETPPAEAVPAEQTEPAPAEPAQPPQ